MKRRLAAAALSVASAGGCLAGHHLPSYEETAAAWDPVDAGFGRIVVYTAENPAIFGRGPRSLDLRVDDTRIDLWEKTFVFADLPPGLHTVSNEHPNLVEQALGREGVLELDVPAGEIVYVEIDWRGAPELVPRPEALARLQELRHALPDSLPINP